MSILVILKIMNSLKRILSMFNKCEYSISMTVRTAVVKDSTPCCDSRKLVATQCNSVVNSVAEIHGIPILKTAHFLEEASPFLTSFE